MKIWHSFITPNARLNPDNQRRARLLNVLLGIIGLGVLVLIPTSQANSLLQPNPRTFYPELGGLIVVAVCWFLNRFTYTEIAAFFFFLTINLLVLIYLLTENDEAMGRSLQSIPCLLVIPVVASGVMLRPDYSFIFAGISIAGTVAVAIMRVGANVPLLETPFNAITTLSIPTSLLLAMAGLSWFFESNIQSLIHQLTTQNRNLDAANRELAQKRKVELQLNQRIDELTRQVSESFGEQNKNTADQLSALFEVTSTIEELSQTNEAIYRIAGQVDTTAQEALRVAEEGASNVRGGLQSLIMLNERAQAMATAMDELYTQARQIDQIIELITEVAEETNLLALNATIEAAGAREYGRRFASVANEVQRLANRSREAADQVRQVVEEIRGAIENSSAVAQKGVREAAQIMSGTRQIESTLEGIVHMVESTATQSRQISLSIQQQRGATVQVVETMRHISTLSHSVARGSQDLMNNLYELNEAVNRLSNVTVNQSQATPSGNGTV